MDIISQSEIFLRLISVVCIAGVLGFERESTPQPAGIRTHILIGLGATTITLLAIMLPQMYPESINGGGRIISSIVSGIGFLGAGAIIKLGVDTRGVTTAATIWVTAAIGICIGAGLYILAFTIAALILVDLIFVTKLKGTFMASHRYSTLELVFSDTDIDLEKIVGEIQKLSLKIVSRHISEDTKNITLKLVVKTKKSVDILSMKTEIQRLQSKEKISLSETVDL